MNELARCAAEIAEAEANIRAGHEDVHGLVLQMIDWAAEALAIARENNLVDCSFEQRHVSEPQGADTTMTTFAIDAENNIMALDPGMALEPGSQGFSTEAEFASIIDASFLMRAFDAALDSLFCPFLQVMQRVLQMIQRVAVFLAGEWTHLETAQPVDADSDQRFLRQTVNSMLADWPILKVDFHET